MNIPKWLYYAVMLLSLFLLLIRWRRLDSKLHIFLGILLAAFLTEKIHDLFYPAPVSKYIYHVYQTVETILLCIYYYALFQLTRNRRIVLAGITIYLVYFLYDFVYHAQNLLTYKRTDMVIEGFIITIFSILYLIELYQKEQPVILKTHPHFWIVIANLLFYPITLVFYVFQFYLLKNSPDYKILSIIPQITNIFLYAFYSIAFVCQMPMKKFV